MHEYDAILKRILMRFTSDAASVFTGIKASRWLNVELPRVRNLRVDLLAESSEGRLLHIELQSTNDRSMARRMLDYSLSIYDRFGVRPEQLVLYTGEAPLRMSGVLEPYAFECRIVDIRDFDPEPLLASDNLAENVITVLMRHPEPREALRRILGKIAKASPAERVAALADVFILAGLRRMAPLVEEEAAKMPILNDIMDHEVLGPKLRDAMARGLKEGRQEGRQEGELEIVRRMVAKRFGGLPGWAESKLNEMTIVEIENMADRLLDAYSLEELFGSI